MTGEAPRLELESFLPYRLNVLAEVVSQSLARLYSQRYGLSIAEWRVVATLGQYERMTATAICTHSHMHKTKVSRAVTGLVERGLVERVANSQDLREAFLMLTADGQRVYDEFVPEAVAFDAGLTEGMGEMERGLIEATITRLIERSQALSATLGEDD
ncbi:MAG: MarR family transcriptional regulator [Hyphomicrobiales bacterium]